jgi:hypothetical protein
MLGASVLFIAPSFNENQHPGYLLMVAPPWHRLSQAWEHDAMAE